MMLSISFAWLVVCNKCAEKACIYSVASGSDWRR
jgi:hypothetical protein